MDKRVIFAVAGAGKTTYIIDTLSVDKRSLIITYTNGNYNNLIRKTIDKFGGHYPKNITVMTYYLFLFNFCYKPFLADEIRARGITYEKKPDKFAKQSSDKYYLTPDRYFYSNRLALFLMNRDGVFSEIQSRIKKYYDELIIDEVQDIAGRDFDFLERLMCTEIGMLFVGDFFQHTYDTSRDGVVNKSLFDDRNTYENRFKCKGVTPDSDILKNSWRCSKKVCNFVSNELGINIFSNRTDDEGDVFTITDPVEKTKILNNPGIVKLHYNRSAERGLGHRNWGDAKGEDSYEDVCIILNKKTADLYKNRELYKLPPTTLNKLYVAITRAHRNVYLIYD